MTDASSLLLAEGLRYEVLGDAGPLAVLDGVSLGLKAGEIVDITGPSGSGKTTLLRALARLLPLAEGSLALLGTPAGRIRAQEWRRRVALLPQRASLARGSVRDNLLLPWTLKVRSAEDAPADQALVDALASVGLDDVALERDAARLSVGQTARVALLRVVHAGPEVLLLDEPDANLDDASADAVRAMTVRFAAAGGAVVRVRHLRSDGHAARRLRLERGRIEQVESDGR